MTANAIDMRYIYDFNCITQNTGIHEDSVIRGYCNVNDIMKNIVAKSWRYYDFPQYFYKQWYTYELHEEYLPYNLAHSNWN